MLARRPEIHGRFHPESGVDFVSVPEPGAVPIRSDTIRSDPTRPDPTEVGQALSLARSRSDPTPARSERTGSG